MSDSPASTPSEEPDLSQRYTILRSTKEGPVPPRDVAGQCAREITRELKRLKQWIDPPPPLPEFRAAFGMDAMPFTLWIQLVLVPRLLAIAEGTAEIPHGSMLAAHAVREFDGQDEYVHLIDLLRYVDDLTGGVDALGLNLPTFRRNPLPPASVAALMLGIVVAAVAGWMGAQEIIDWLTSRAAPTLFQRIEGLPTPSAGFQDLVADSGFEVQRDGSLHPESISFLMPRAMREMSKGVIRVLEMRANDPVDRKVIDEWFRFHEVDGNAASTQRTAQAIEQTVTAMQNTKSRDDLATLPMRIGNGATLGSSFEAPPHLSERVEGTVLVFSLLLTTVPTLLILVRILRAKEGRKRAAAA